MESVSGPGRVRDRYVDFLRVAAIGAVVFGHWLVTSLTYRDGGFAAANVLRDISWAPWVTWGFQVMPIFFLVGGFAAGYSWNAGGRGRAPGYGPGWLRRRAVRLLGPTTGYVVVAVVAMGAAEAAGAPADTLDLAGWAIALHLWFLPVYLLLTLLTPALYSLHRRYGPAVPVAMALLGVAIDVLVIDSHVKAVGWLNYLLVWGAAYQLGFAWQDGSLTRRRRTPLLIAGLGAAAFVGLEWSGLFPVSLIGEQGEQINNTAPPSVALVAYGAAQLGALIAIAPPVSRWLRRDRVWRVVEVCNVEVMTVYLWQMLPVVLGGVLLYPARWMPQPTVGSAEWWLLRPVWMAALAILLAPLVAISRRIRRPAAYGSGATEPPPRGFPPLLWAAAGLTSFALARFAIAGFAPGGRPPVEAVAVYAAGVLLVAADVLLRRRDRLSSQTTATA